MYHFIESLAPLARAKAYLDPGSGSILLQLLIAAALGAAFAVKVYWKKIKGVFGKKEDAGEPDQPSTAEPEESENKK
jgi:hypothetical protein